MISGSSNNNNNNNKNNYASTATNTKSFQTHMHASHCRASFPKPIWGKHHKHSLENGKLVPAFPLRFATSSLLSSHPTLAPPETGCQLGRTTSWYDAGNRSRKHDIYNLQQEMEQMEQQPELEQPELQEAQILATTNNCNTITTGTATNNNNCNITSITNNVYSSRSNIRTTKTMQTQQQSATSSQSSVPAGMAAASNGSKHVHQLGPGVVANAGFPASACS
eukprot:jgi/Psemu1/263/gm1.263_g